ncbi:hypothetical protein KPL71_021641 [Citrus sinensis]|uniref:Uncharacterized protein n=1 Tax=Citrus sinensis TaxID=2711 RepID=A0ACB8JGS5_CITSI|nr:hypothetical protein KPL71_021641 [Citrus sinensis]
MASSSQNPVQLSSSMSLPKTVTKHTTSKIESLVEYSYIPDSAQVNESSLPLVNPYQLYQRPSRFTRSIRSLISTSRSTPKEYIQSSSLDQCSLQSTSAEQYVTLEISPELISHWKQQRYTHFHLGGVRLILTLHGRKGLPVTARIALLDTLFKQYEQATIGTLLTTLHAGSVVLTVYPNFNLSLDDPNLSTFLKIQVQIQGAEQVSSAKIASIHHQLVYRLQNHSLILPTPPDLSSDTLMILAESPDIPTIIQIPRQIPRADLLKIMPLEWITNYEHFHQNTTPVQTSEPMYEKRPDEVLPSGKTLPIMSFTSQGTPVYPDKIDGHFLWDVPGSGRCNPGCPCNDDEDDYSSRPKKKNIIYPACKLYLPKDDDDEPDYPPPLPLYNKGLQWIQKHQPRSCKPVRSSAGLLPTPPMVSCMMFSSASASASDYSSEYPPLENRSDQKHQVWSKPFVMILSFGGFWAICFSCWTAVFSPDTDQIEFLYSEQESPDPDTVFALGTSDSDSDSASSTEPEDYSPVFHIRSVPSSSTQLSVQPIPSVKIQILLSKYSRPIPAIAFIDTGAQRIWTHVIGSSLPDKDLLLGFDILFQAQKIQVLPTGLRFQSMFQPYTDQLKLYHLAQSPPDYQSISAQLLRFCPPNHLAFAHPHPLWKNPAHFVKLPFKLNEDLNPTKATHPGIELPPSELQLAQIECAELLAQGLIERTTSPWACQAFYVNKRAETLRGTPEEHQVLLQQFHDELMTWNLSWDLDDGRDLKKIVQHLGSEPELSRLWANLGLREKG